MPQASQASLCSPGGFWGCPGDGVLNVKKQHTSRSVKSPGKRCSACDEVCARCSDNIGPMTEEENALKLPGVEVGSLLCLRALYKHLSSLSLQDMVDLLTKAHRANLLNLPN